MESTGRQGLLNRMPYESFAAGYREPGLIQRWPMSIIRGGQLDVFWPAPFAGSLVLRVLVTRELEVQGVTA
jgi:hypothetical protein